MITHDPKVVMKYIEFYRREIRLGNTAQPPYNYVTFYKERFEPFLRKYIKENFLGNK